jgi:hypothetical protein
MIRQRTAVLRALLLLVALVANAARADDQVQAPLFKEGDFWKFKVVEKPVNGSSSTAIQYPNGIFTLRDTARGRMRVQEFVENKETPLESGRYTSRILRLLGLRQPAGLTTTFNILLPFPFYVGKQWRDSYKPTGIRAVHHTVNSEVVAEQQVATQAGNLRALKIERTEQAAITHTFWGGSFMPTARGAYYYSPETKSIVKYDFVGDEGYELHIELLEFAPAH